MKILNLSAADVLTQCMSRRRRMNDASLANLSSDKWTNVGVYLIADKMQHTFETMATKQFGVNVCIVKLNQFKGDFIFASHRLVGLSFMLAAQGRWASMALA